MQKVLLEVSVPDSAMLSGIGVKERLAHWASNLGCEVKTIDIGEFITGDCKVDNKEQPAKVDRSTDKVEIVGSKAAESNQVKGPTSHQVKVIADCDSAGHAEFFYNAVRLLFDTHKIKGRIETDKIGNSFNRGDVFTNCEMTGGTPPMSEAETLKVWQDVYEQVQAAMRLHNSNLAANLKKIADGIPENAGAPPAMHPILSGLAARLDSRKVPTTPVVSPEFLKACMHLVDSILGR